MTESVAPTPYGIAPYVTRAVERIRQHFREPPQAGGKGEAFVIGVFGEWGSGKSTVLNAIGASFGTDAAQPTDVTLRIDFNAWRFEREEHLLLPLLKTIQRTLDQYIASLPTASTTEQVADAVKGFWPWSKPASPPNPAAALASGDRDKWKWLAERATLLGATTIALTRMFKVKAGIPGFGEVEFNPSEGLTAAQAQIDRARKLKTTEREHESLYYDLYAQLRRITRGDSSDQRQLNFVFLVDDLDRCLPEKAVEMLEAIKLFLDVEGCAFVLGLDDEVIERGIAHRYRDYLRPPDDGRADNSGNRPSDQAARYADATVPPITGHEYLEKIVQLPFRLPRWSKREVREFVSTRFGDVLSRWSGTPTDSLTYTSPPTQADSWLLDLIVDAVPPIPRNLVRAIELLEFTRGVAIDRKLGDRLQAYPLAQMVLLQLFAPQCFRFLRRGNADGWKTFEKRLLKDHAEFTEPDIIDVIQRQPAIFSERFFDWWEELCTVRLSTFADPYIDRTERPLIRHLRAARVNRGGFDPRNLILFNRDNVRVDGDLEQYFSLFAETAARPGLGTPQPGIGIATPVPQPREVPPTAPGQAAAPAPVKSAPPVSTPSAPITPPLQAPTTAAAGSVTTLTAAPRDRDEFVRQLLSPTPEAWRNAITREDALIGRTLDERTFDDLLSRLKLPNAPARDVSWLETVAPILSAAQMRALVRETHMLRNWAKAARVIVEPQPPVSAIG